MQFTFTAPAGGGGAGAINPDEIMAAMGRGGGSGPGFWGMADIMRRRLTRVERRRSRCSRR